METAAVTTIRIRLPSHTRRRGARADFGRLFKRTKKGSKTWAVRGSDQRKRAVTDQGTQKEAYQGFGQCDSGVEKKAFIQKHVKQTQKDLGGAAEYKTVDHS